MANSAFVHLTDSRLTWRFSLATDQPKISQSTPRLVSLPPKYTLSVDPPKRCSTSVRYNLIHSPQWKELFNHIWHCSGLIRTFFQPMNNLLNLMHKYQLTDSECKTSPLNSSSQRDMRLICPSWSTTTVLGQPSPAARAWCSAKAALAWVQTATSWERGTTCCAPSPLSRPPAPRQAASTTDQNAHRASQTVSGWSPSRATAKDQHSAAWASQPAAGAAAAAPSWNQAFSAPNDSRKTM